MARSAGNVIENNLSKGLVTEASHFNFPENAATEAYDVVFERIGRVRRRLGIDVETQTEIAVYQEASGVIVEFLWRSVARTGMYTFLVLQLGSNISFYALGDGVGLGAGLKEFAVDLLEYKAPGGGDPSLLPASFASGNGKLFITHPDCDPIVVEYDEDEDDITKTAVSVEIRDFEGIDDGLALDENPTTLSPEHYYNLKNQGWGLKLVRMVTPGGGAGPDRERGDPVDGGSSGDPVIVTL